VSGQKRKSVEIAINPGNIEEDNHSQIEENHSQVEDDQCLDETPPPSSKKKKTMESGTKMTIKRILD
jgi:hypothetical protein